MGKNWNRWSPEEIEILKTRFPNEQTKTIAADMQKTKASVNGKAQELGLKKTPEHMAKDKELRKEMYPRNTGRPSPRKGMKGYSPPGSEKTRFRLGNIPLNAKEIGSERMDSDGYWERKITNTKGRKDWVRIHTLVWEQHHGPVPKTHLLVFKDGNRNNYAIENLELISRAELLGRNSIHNLPKEYQEIVYIRRSINKAIKEREDT